METKKNTKKSKIINKYTSYFNINNSTYKNNTKENTKNSKILSGTKHNKIDKVLKDKWKIIKNNLKDLNINKKTKKLNELKKKEKIKNSLYTFNKTKNFNFNKEPSIYSKNNTKTSFTFYDNYLNEKRTKRDSKTSLEGNSDKKSKKLYISNYFNKNKENKEKKKEHSKNLSIGNSNNIYLNLNLNYNNSLVIDSNSKDNCFYSKNILNLNNKIEYYVEDLKKSFSHHDKDYFFYMRRFHLKQNFNLLKKYFKLKNKNIFSHKFIVDLDKPIIFFDLDETLIHCSLEKNNDFCDKINFNNKIIFVYKRPYLKDLLENLYINFNLVLFTAAKEDYAIKILSLIDPFNKYFKLKLFRKHCISIEKGIYVKDLTIIKNINLKKCCIVDNSIISFINQIDNGIPIIPFFGNNDDNELNKLKQYLNSLKNISDITIINNLKFQFSNYLCYNDIDKLIKDLFINK